MKALFPTHGRGKELYELMRKELNVPDHVKWFEVRFAYKELITVTCHYFPPPSNEPLTPGF